MKNEIDKYRGQIGEGLKGLVVALDEVPASVIILVVVEGRVLVQAFDGEGATPTTRGVAAKIEQFLETSANRSRALGTRVPEPMRPPAKGQA